MHALCNALLRPVGVTVPALGLEIGFVSQNDDFCARALVPVLEFSPIALRRYPTPHPTTAQGRR
jgi:hypothetical protein